MVVFHRKGHFARFPIPNVIDGAETTRAVIEGGIDGGQRPQGYQQVATIAVAVAFILVVHPHPLRFQVDGRSKEDRGLVQQDRIEMMLCHLCFILVMVGRLVTIQSTLIRVVR